MSVYRFAHPLYLQWLWLVPVIVAIAWWLARHQRARLEKQFGAKLFPFLSASISTPKRRWKLFLEVAVITGFLLALAQPQAGESRQKVKSEGIEVMILFDVSNSMLAEDVKPSRLELAKSEINRYLSLSSGDRVGLIAFAGSAVLLSPLTPDKPALRMYIDSLTPEAVSTQGTDFESALKEARDAFKRGGGDASDDGVLTRAVVVVSDGEDNEEGALKAAELLDKEGIKIFTLGFGTEKGGAIPVRDEWGNLRGYKKDKTGKVVLSQTKGTVLKEIARLGGGSFHHVTFGSAAMANLRKDIEQLQKSEFESAEVTNYDEKFQTFLLAALLLALLEIVLGERRGAGRLWRGRFEVAGS